MQSVPVHRLHDGDIFSIWDACHSRNLAARSPETLKVDTRDGPTLLTNEGHLCMLHSHVLLVGYETFV